MRGRQDILSLGLSFSFQHYCFIIYMYLYLKRKNQRTKRSDISYRSHLRNPVSGCCFCFFAHQHPSINNNDYIVTITECKRFFLVFFFKYVCGLTHYASAYLYWWNWFIFIFKPFKKTENKNVPVYKITVKLQWNEIIIKIKRKRKNSKPTFSNVSTFLIRLVFWLKLSDFGNRHPV